MKLTAAKFALLVLVLLVLGMFVNAAPQTSADDGTSDTSSPTDGTSGIPGFNGGSTPGSGTTGSGKTGTDTGTSDNSSGDSTGKSSDSGQSSSPSSGAKTSSGSKTPSDSSSNGNSDSSDSNSNSNSDSNSVGNSDSSSSDSSSGSSAKSSQNSGNGSGKSNKNANSGSNAKGNSNANTNGAKGSNANANSASADATNSQGPNSASPSATDSSDPSASPDLKSVNQTCSTNDECDSGSCQNNLCAAADNSGDDDKAGKMLGMVLGIVVAVMCVGMVLLTAMRMILKRRRTEYYSRRISDIATPSRATTPSFYHDSSSLVLEKQASRGQYAFQSPDSAVSSDNVRPPVQGHTYGAADGYDMEKSYTRKGMPTYTNDQHLYAPNQPSNDWSITPTFGAFPTSSASTPAREPSPIPVPQPTMLPLPSISQTTGGDSRSNGSNMLGARDGERDSELILYGGAGSQNLTRQSVYDASDDQEEPRYKMNSIYSAYGRDSLYADTRDAPSVPDVPLPYQNQ